MSAPATLNMEITPDIEQRLKDHPFYLEIEMLQGNKTFLPDGMIQYRIEIHDAGKIAIVKEFLLKLMSNSLNAIMN